VPDRYFGMPSRRTTRRAALAGAIGAGVAATAAAAADPATAPTGTLIQDNGKGLLNLNTGTGAIDFRRNLAVGRRKVGSSTSLVVDAEVTTFVDARTFGVVADSREPMHEQINAAWRAAHDRHVGAVLLPAGTMLCRGELVEPASKPRLIGMGSGDDEQTSITVLKFDEDLGDGKFALRPAAGGLPFHIEGITFLGPGAGDASIGASVSKMYGVGIRSRGIVRDVVIRFFRDGCTILDADHTWFDGVRAQSCAYGLNWVDGAQGGDTCITRCDFSGNRRASWGISSHAKGPTNLLAEQTHLGFSPYYIHRYRGREGKEAPEMIQGLTFIASALESTGSGGFCDEAGGGIIDSVTMLRTDMGDCAGAVEFEWKGHPRRAAIDCAALGNYVALNSDISIVGGRSPSGSIPHVRAADVSNVQARWNAVRDLAVDEPDTPLIAMSGGGAPVGVVLDQGGGRGTVLKASEPVARGDLLEFDGPGRARRARAARPAVGVALADAKRDATVTAASYGQDDRHAVRNLTGAKLASGTLVRADPAHPGGVRSAASTDDGHPIGVLGGDLAPDGKPGGAAFLFGMAG
jgi:hypothetical protein